MQEPLCEKLLRIVKVAALRFKTGSEWSLYVFLLRDYNEQFRRQQLIIRRKLSVPLISWWLSVLPIEIELFERFLIHLVVYVVIAALKIASTLRM